MIKDDHYISALRLISFSITLVFCLASCGQSKEPLQAGVQAPILSPAPAISKRILVIGGTAGIGLETVKLALARGHSVSAMSRRPERLDLSHDNLKLIKGDVLDAGSVSRALENQDIVIFSVGMAPTREPVTLFSQGAKNVLAAMRGNNIERILLVSGIGAGDSRGHGGFFYDNIMQPLLLKTIYEDKDRSEQLIRDSALQWTIVRPGFLDDTASKAQYRVVEDLTGVKSGDISRADVAHFMISSAESSGYIGSTVLLSN